MRCLRIGREAVKMMAHSSETISSPVRLYEWAGKAATYPSLPLNELAP
jgi:hypothetical protein